jgi:thiamine-phosphate pyrophosphorylase
METEKLLKTSDLESQIMRMLTSGYYFITSSSDNPVTDRPVLDTVIDALNGGASIVQYREKSFLNPDKRPTAAKIKALQSFYDFTFIINDDPVLAREVDADGVHLGQKDLSKFSYLQVRALLGSQKIIGISASTMEQAENALKMGADYISLGPVYKTSTKLDGDAPCGLDLIEKVRKRMDSGQLRKTPIVTIGGINMSNYKDIIRAGADMVCMIHPVLQHNNVADIINSIRDNISHAHKKHY